MITATRSDHEAFIAQLAKLPGAGARKRLLAGNGSLNDPALVELLYEEVVKLARVDLSQADRLARAAAWVARKLQNEYCLAQSFRAAGHVFLIRGKFGEALQSYRSALSLFRRLNREVDIGRTLYGGSLQALIYLGQYDQAFAWALEARAIFERHGDKLRLARLDSNLGNILYRQDRFEEALECYRRAGEELEQLGQPQDVAIAHRNIAVCYISLAKFDLALQTYHAARAHCERHGLKLLVAEMDYNIAYLHFQRGEYARAIELYQATRAHCETLGDPYHKALCDLDQSEMYLELNQGEEGARLAAHAASSFRELGMRYEEGKAFAFLAISASHQGQAEQALDLFGRARRLFSKEQNPIWVALIDLYQAVVLHENGFDERARVLCESAHEIFVASTLESKAILCRLLSARLHLRAGDLAKARRECAGVIERIDEAETPVLSYQARFVMGQIEEARREFGPATRAYEKAHASLENLRSQLKGEELKIAFLQDKLAIYESLIWMRLKGTPGRKEKEEAFAYIEQAKSRSLADLMISRKLELPLRMGAQGDASRNLRRLRDDLNWCYRQIEQAETGQDKPTAQRLKRLHDRSRKCEDELIRAMASLRGADERLSLLQAAGTVKLKNIRSMLSDGSVLLEYCQVREHLYACVLDHATLEIIPLGRASKVRSLQRLLQFQFSKFQLGADHMRRFSASLQAAAQAHLRELYRELIAPVRKWLKAKHVIIVPHGFLHQLPFHALHDGRRFLIDDFSISYAPSASVWYLTCARPAVANNCSLILGIPDSDAPHIFEEVCQVASMLPRPRIFLGMDATEEHLRLNAPASRFVHVASHGLFRQDNPMFCSMRLGDSNLNLLDLYSMDLTTELFTLSGCGTGLNAVVGGDELLGLVRGLLYAGTRAMLVSLWDVNDRSTADFMKSFYGHLASEVDKSRALQKAMLEVREQYPHPYFWAPFVLIGKAANDPQFVA